MLDQKVALVALIRGDESVENEAVERIVDVGDPRQGRRSAVAGKHLTERGDHVRCVGQAQSRAVNRTHVKTMPAPNGGLMGPAPEEMAVQFDEGGWLKLLAGRAQGALGHDALGHLGALKNLKELIQFPLKRAFDQVQQEEEHNGKGQGAVAGEICFAAPMPGQKGRIVDQISKGLNEVTMDVEGFPRSCPEHYFVLCPYQPLTMGTYLGAVYRLSYSVQYLLQRSLI